MCFFNNFKLVLDHTFERFCFFFLFCNQNEWTDENETKFKVLSLPQELYNFQLVTFFYIFCALYYFASLIRWSPAYGFFLHYQCYDYFIQTGPNLMIASLFKRQTVNVSVVVCSWFRYVSQQCYRPTDGCNNDNIVMAAV